MKEISKNQSTYICPNCSAIAEWNAYYGRFTCTRCTYEWGPDEKEQKSNKCCGNCKFCRVEADNNHIGVYYCRKGRKKKLLDQLKLQDECNCKYFEKDVCDISTEEWNRVCAGLAYAQPGHYD